MECYFRLIKITLMHKDQPQRSYCQLADDPVNFRDLCGDNYLTEESGDWFKIEYIKMTENEYNKLPEFTGF